MPEPAPIPRPMPASPEKRSHGAARPIRPQSPGFPGRSTTALAGPAPRSQQTPAPSPTRDPPIPATPRSSPTLSHADPTLRIGTLQLSPPASRALLPSLLDPSGAPRDSQTAPERTSAPPEGFPLIRPCSQRPDAPAAPPRSPLSQTCAQGSASGRTDPQANVRPSTATGPQPKGHLTRNG